MYSKPPRIIDEMTTSGEFLARVSLVTRLRVSTSDREVRATNAHRTMQKSFRSISE